MNSTVLVRIAGAIDRLNGFVGRIAAWAVLAMVVVQFAIVALRYVFGFGSLWMQEALHYLLAILVLFAAGWTLQADGHVRVDVFYAEAAPRTKAKIDLAGALLLLVPFMAAIIWYSWPYASRAWAIGEGSREAGGIPLVFLLKSSIPLFAALMLLQGLAQAGRAALALMSDRSSGAAAR
ncbi:TRAP transporter small permease subunit [Bradyrhizobium sp. LHD-71]|uniref:TRAP transporter small permease subunit n=1 Tax=Bradyrhizobium sp. LHD-71 TaxID=3072141 RepID=UPI0028108C82|nr:TRAP transporter small permease subunit [Bradyrhizobium sp. LHD-71]MDQ8728970.1 TRAP transporter small permease subunit [Bradyrhizobium sp. LHD-71]